MELPRLDVEVNAIDTAWDTIVRFRDEMPFEFYCDWVRMAADEARHFTLLQERLSSHGSFYGALPAHAIIWNIAGKTMHDMKARLAIMQLVEEPRGLDAWNRLVERFRGSGDHQSAKLIDLICSEEVEHVRIGVRWFDWLCARNSANPLVEFRKITEALKPPMLPPFNVQARDSAGLPREFYQQTPT